MINLGKVKSIDMMKYFKAFVVAIVMTTVFYSGFQLSMQDNAYYVLLDDNQVGIINMEDENLANEAFEEAESIIEEELNHEINIHESLSLEPTHVSKKEMMTKEELISSIKDNVTYDIKVYNIKVDGEIQAVVESMEEAEAVLEEVKNNYIEEENKNNIEEISFVEEVDIESEFIDSLEDVLTKEEAVAKLTKSTNEEKKYIIKEGDTLWDVAIRYDMTVEDLLKANPGLEEDSIIQIGQEINLVIPKPIISVMTKEKYTYTEPIEKPVVYKEDDSKYKTEVEILEEGEEGEKEITAYKIRINGYEEGEEIISEEVIKEPKEEVILIGTKTPPPKSATGSFRMPVSGTLTSGFGSRWGTFHAGIDLAAPIGTPIYASDGGTVVKAGWSNGYGYLVIIDHGNGFQTYYAHASEIYVSVGQKVAKGEKIAAVGSTGNSTGPHLHFEIRKNGEAQNPYNYL
ncbi:LysM peptidoglycan-binding domain-containing M23 family metallopeptidase [Defluviitalea phaphyphila]|uniref:LysM peptidoglycan-binding domain-containing M23 family metallopeptidase n=1 Tax=Defluviitalea phaphyphila TaxID=1473580 RepID=UPI00073069DC|nr:M23 family metallopeptidase [Defluviitalea phaphyphila]